MSVLRHGELGKKLKAGMTDRCCILYGEEKYLVEYYRREIRRVFLGEQDDGFNYRRFNGTEIDPEGLAETVNAYPAFAEHSLVELRDFDIFSWSDKSAKKLAELFGDLPDYCCVVFVYDTLEYKPDKRKKKLCEAVQAAAAEVECPLQSDADLLKWIKNRFKKEKKQISPSDAEFLLFLAGNRMDNLGNEIDKLSLYAEGSVITRDDIERVVVPVAEAGIFKLTDELSAGRYESAAEQMYKLLQLNTEPIYLTAVIGAQLRKLYAAKLVKESGGSPAVLKDIINAYNDYQPKQYLRICGKFSTDWYRMAMKACCETDYRLKSVSDPPEGLLWNLFLKLAVKRN